MIDMQRLAEFEAEERTEVLQGIAETANDMLAAVQQLNTLLVDTGDIANISNDAFDTLVMLMRTLDKRYDLNSMLQQAQEVE
jgi:mannitol/fructose-specific phosphotransferase system IIA component